MFFFLLIYAPRIVRAAGEILFHHLNMCKSQGVVKMSDCGNTDNVQILFDFAPMGIFMKRPGSLTLASWGPGSYLIKGAVSSRSCLYLRIGFTYLP